MRRSKAVSALSLIAASALVLTACSGGDEGGDPNTGSSSDIEQMATGKAQENGVFKLAEAAESDKVTVAVDRKFTAYNNNTPDTNTSYNTYVLVTVLAGAHIYDGNNKVLLNGDVMDSVEMTSTEPQVVEYKIKPDVKWSDGEAWDCDDFYLAWLANSGKIESFQAVSPAGYKLIEQAECTDDQTFVTTYSEPYLDYEGLFNTTILPAHVLEQETGIGDITQFDLNSPAEELKPAGEFWSSEWKGFKPDIMPASGPYKIASFDDNAGIVTLERNKDFVGAKGGPQTVVVRAMPKTTEMASALQNGEIDVASSTQPDATSAQGLKDLASQGVTYGSAPQLSYEHIDLNYERIFADKAVRTAFFQAIEREEILNKLIQPIRQDAQVLNSVMYFEGEQGYEDRYSGKAGQAAQAAAKTLQDAGWTKGADGIFEKDGERLSIAISHNDNDRRSQTVEILIPQLKEAGIEVKDNTDPAFFDGPLSNGDWDACIYAWSAAPFKAESSSIFLSPDNGGEQNYQGLANPQIDEAMNKAVSATDESAQREGYQKADELIAEERASLPLFQMPSMWAFRGIDRVFFQGYFGSLWNVGEWERTS
ncbi:ABC transporter family substrate-binding protein [Amycolatopsis cihanbeyliensis]|uniref:Peptide/nickel transport system substrate-binding protein n=1 Tax=Amycolatopsis cihanbeyliensis TaxID=1128664 RepID=A0A542DHP6_AMYCI|nr:ABC transporter family substrate-binding protein [Amycolatopsis cihanbeyliensis]TQJ02575.1 peptide/nickel transport system substrate-binding protein [Amycolatopsis cihanbeyliensis]